MTNLMSQEDPPPQCQTLGGSSCQWPIPLDRKENSISCSIPIGPSANASLRSYHGRLASRLFLRSQTPPARSTPSFNCTWIVIPRGSIGRPLLMGFSVYGCHSSVTVCGPDAHSPQSCKMSVSENACFFRVTPNLSPSGSEALTCLVMVGSHFEIRRRREGRPFAPACVRPVGARPCSRPPQRRAARVRRCCDFTLGTLSDKGARLTGNQLPLTAT